MRIPRVPRFPGWWSGAATVGLVAALASMGIPTALAAPRQLFAFVTDRMFYRVELRSGRPEYDYVLMWLEQQPMMWRSTRMTFPPSLERSSSEAEDLQVVPGYGTHAVWWGGIPVVVHRGVDQDRKRSLAFSQAVPEIITVTIASRDGECLRRWLREVAEVAKQHRQKRVFMYISEGDTWQLLHSKPKRALETLHLPDQIKSVVAEVGKFLSSREEYERLGVPWRRGYAFVGPPGCGKSSLAMAIASEHNLAVCVLHLKRSAIDDTRLLRLINCLPPRSLVVIEDIDTVEFQQATSNGVTVSGLLNALDGVASSEGRVLLLTANNKDLLPPALLRQGRVDRVLKFEKLTVAACSEMIKRFIDDKVSAAFTILELCPSQLTPAELQDILLQRTSLTTAT